MPCALSHLLAESNGVFTIHLDTSASMTATPSTIGGTIRYQPTARGQRRGGASFAPGNHCASGRDRSNLALDGCRLRECSDSADRGSSDWRSPRLIHRDGLIGCDGSNLTGGISDGRKVRLRPLRDRCRFRRCTREPRGGESRRARRHRRGALPRWDLR
jgi:hypothetical protein